MRALAVAFFASLALGCGLHFGVDAALGGADVGTHAQRGDSPRQAVEAYRSLVMKLCADGSLPPTDCAAYLRLIPILESAVRP